MVDTSTINTLPDAGTASFNADLQTFLAEEDAERFDLILNPFVVENGLHGTGGSLTGDPGDTTAFPQGFYVNETGVIVYNDNTAHHWVIIFKDTTTVVGGDWIRVSGTHYLFDPVSASQPTIPAGGLILMDVVTSGGSITTVTDLRNLSAFAVQNDVFKVKVSSDDTTANFLLSKLAAGSGIALTETNPGADETITIVADAKTVVSANDTTAGFLEDKITAGDGIKETVQNAFGNEDLLYDLDLSTTSGMEFTGGKLRVNTIANGGVALNANGVVLDITGTTETTSNLDTPDDELIIEDNSQTGEKKRKIKVSLIVPTGMTIPWIGTFAAVPPDAWIHANGNTIGNGSSGGTERANTDTEQLFTLLWDNMADAQAAVSTGRGASAAADFAADKTITLPDLQGMMAVGTGGTAMTTHGDTGGEETHVLTVAELAAHTHTENKYNDTGGAVAGSNTADNLLTTPQTGSTGSDTAHENMPPWVSLSWIIKL
ncbi:hypothetical protein LCGC14_0690150 [marine sediment metagenome]|uniref:Phage tail collar domain-containing protein n=1 Tax=marine sediment metagenome TaxID=412755 RepID=A0A0F9T6Z1_9ZZZZ